MAAYNFTITDSPDGVVRITAHVTDKTGGNKTPAGLIALATQTFLTELNNQLITPDDQDDEHRQTLLH